MCAPSYPYFLLRCAFILRHLSSASSHSSRMTHIYLFSPILTLLAPFRPMAPSDHLFPSLLNQMVLIHQTPSLAPFTRHTMLLSSSLLVHTERIRALMTAVVTDEWRQVAKKPNNHCGWSKFREKKHNIAPCKDKRKPIHGDRDGDMRASTSILRCTHARTHAAIFKVPRGSYRLKAHAPGYKSLYFSSSLFSLAFTWERLCACPCTHTTTRIHLCSIKFFLQLLWWNLHGHGVKAAVE